MNPDIQAGLARLQQGLIDEIASNGWSTVTCFASETEPGFTYTVGLSGQGLPEIIVFGLPPETARGVLQASVNRAKEAGSLAVDTPVDRIFANAPAYFRAIPANAAKVYLRFACGIAGAVVITVKLIWPDEAGVFPWDSKFSARLRPTQPLLCAAAH